MSDIIITITTYLGALPAEQRHALQHIRNIIHDIAPTAKDGMSYGMPGSAYRGKYLAGYAAFKHHLSFFPTAEPVSELADKLTGYRCSRGTVQFTVDKPLPDTLIRELLAVRIAAIDRSTG